MSENCTHPRVSRRERRKRLTRSELLQAGRQLFSERGLYEVSIENLAERADIAKGTVYLYFRNKEALVHDVVSEGFAELEAFVRTSVSAARTDPELIRGIASAQAEFFETNPDLMRLFHQTRGLLKFPPRWRRLREPLAGYITFLSALLDRSKPGRAGRRRDLALVIFGCVSGVTSMHAVLRRKIRPGLWADLGDALVMLADPPGKSNGANKRRLSTAGADPSRDRARSRSSAIRVSRAKR